MMTLGHQTTQMWSFQEQASKLARCTSLFTPAPTPSIKLRQLRADEGFPGDQLIDPTLSFLPGHPRDLVTKKGTGEQKEVATIPGLGSSVLVKLQEEGKCG